MDDQAQLDGLMAEYRARRDKLTQREKAQTEANIWRLMKSIIGPGVTKEYEKRDWLKAEFGGTTAEYDDRAQIWRYGAWADPLWKHIDEKGLPLHTAILISRRVKNLAANSGASLVTVLAQELENYESSGYRVQTKDGRVFRAKRPYQKPPPSLDLRAPTKFTPPRPTYKTPVPVKNSKDFMAQARDLVDELAAATLPSIDEYIVSELKTDLLEWIKQGWDEFRRKSNFHRADAKREKLAKIGATRFRQACEVLGLKATFGKTFEREKLRKCYVKRVTPLHPDKNNGSHERQHEYEAVVDAYRLLCDYLDQMKEKE